MMYTIQDNWDMLLEGIEQNCPIQDQYSVFKAMRKVAQNLLIDDEKYRTLYADNDMVQKKILGRVGGYEFLRGVGFQQGGEENELVVTSIDGIVIHAAINALSRKITILKQTKSQWDPKYKQKKAAKKNQQQNHQHLIDEEQRMLEEAMRLSEEQHVKDMLARQQKELDAAQQHKHEMARLSSKSNLGGNYGAEFTSQKSVNMYKPHEEDDHKAEEL